VRTGAAAGHDGYFHEAIYHRSDDELLAVVVPFLRGGAEAGEPTFVAFGPEHTNLVRAAMPTDGVEFLTGGDMYARPAGAIQSYRQMLAELTAGGAQQIRIVGELLPPAFGPTWDWWARYESAINHAYDEFPLWSMCAYDVRSTPDEVLRDVARTHPRAATPDGRHLPSEAFVAPPAFLTTDRPAPYDPLLRQAPLVELVDPAPGSTRLAIAQAAPPAVEATTVDGLMLAATEAVTNALRHGVPPVLFRLWSADDRIVVTVSDAGSGTTDPYAGLLPTPRAPDGGLGLWLAHQLCDHVHLHHSADGFTVRLVAGSPYGASDPAPVEAPAA